MMHFEELWELSEKTSTKLSDTQEEILFKLTQDLKEYEKLNNVPSKEIQNILRTKKLGEILFKITQISRIDNINSYAALHTEIKIAEKST